MSAAKQYPFLAKHRIAKPCTMRWEDMKGDAKARHCAGCKKNVYNLSNMTSEEAEALLVSTNGRACTTFFQRADGTVLTQDCPVGLRETYRQRGAWAAIAYCFAFLLGSANARADQPVDPRVMNTGGAPAHMDDIRMPPPGEAPPPPLPPPGMPAVNPQAIKKAPCPLPQKKIKHGKKLKKQPQPPQE